MFAAIEGYVFGVLDVIIVLIACWWGSLMSVKFKKWYLKLLLPYNNTTADLTSSC